MKKLWLCRKKMLPDVSTPRLCSVDWCLFADEGMYQKLWYVADETWLMPVWHMLWTVCGWSVWHEILQTSVRLLQAEVPIRLLAWTERSMCGTAAQWSFWIGSFGRFTLKCLYLALVSPLLTSFCSYGNVARPRRTWKIAVAEQQAESPSWSPIHCLIYPIWLN